MVYTPIVWLLFLAGGVHIALALYCRRHRNVAAARPLELLMWCAAVWPIDCAFDLMTETLWLKILLLQIRFLALPFISVLQLVFIITYLRKEEWIGGWRKALLFTIPVATIILALTTGFHTLYRYNYQVDLSGPFPTLLFTNGIGYQVYIVFTYLVMFTGFVLLLFVQPETHTLYRRQRLLILTGLALPLAFDILYHIGATPYRGLNLVPFAMMISGLIFVYATLRHGLLEIIPVARSKVIEEMSSPMMVIDTQGRMTDMNPAAVRLLGAAREKVIGSPSELVLADFPSIFALVKTASGDHQEIAIGESPHRQFFDATVDDLQTGSGAIVGRLVLLRDITGRKHAEEALRESEETYRTIIENMQDLFYRTNLEGVITMISPSGAKLAGYGSPDEMIGESVYDLYADPLEREKFLAALGVNGAVSGYPLLLKVRSGTFRYVTVSSHVYTDAEGTVRGVEGIIHDVTELRRAEQALLQANRQLNLMSSITRHDILNQLTGLLAYLSFAKESAHEEPLSAYLEKMSIAVNTIHHQIDFTRDYQDLGVHAPEWQRISDIIRAAALDGLPVTDETSDLAIYADPMLVKVFSNLMDNTVRHGGSATGIRVWCRPEESGAMSLIWEDNGIGIPLKDKERIFARGYGKNTGLGLFLIREFLAITGITITETGVPGNGARFEMFVPPEAFRFYSSEQ